MGGWTRLVSHRTPSFWVWLGVWLAALLAIVFHAALILHHEDGAAERALASGQRILIDPATGKITGTLPPASIAPKPAKPSKPEPAIQQPAKPATEIIKTPEAPASATPEAAEPAPESKAQPANPALAEPNSGNALPPVRTDLQEKGKEGTLPVVAPDGTTPARAYARAAPAKTDKPRVALLVMQLGLNPAAAQAVLALPPEISVSVSPYAPKPGEWLALARNRGHEALLDLPMEPRDFPISDAGPYALSPREDATENQRRLHWVMERGEGYAGLAATPREHFLGQSGPTLPILQELRKRGLLLVTSSPRAALVLAQLQHAKTGPQLSASTVLDDMLSPEAVDAQLAALEATARKDGQGLAILRPYPLSLARVKMWLDGLEARGLQLVPVTALLPAEKDAPSAPVHHE